MSTPSVPRASGHLSRWLGRAPITLTLALAALASTALWTLTDHQHPVARAVLADMDAMAAGQLWRLVTGPLVHATWDHLIWDGVLLCVLGWFYEPRMRAASPWLVPWLVALGLLVPTLAVWLAHPHAGAYFGLSGLTYALMAAILCFELRQDHQRWYLWALGIALAFKVGRDIVSTSDILVTTELGATVDKAPEAHLFGVLAGILVFAFARVSGVTGPAIDAGLEVDAADRPG